MSYDLCFWSSRVPVLPSDAERIYLQLCDNNEVLEPGANAEINLQHFWEALTNRYPEPASFSNDDIDNCVWSCSFDVSTAHIMVCMSYSRKGEVVPYALQIASEHELAVYDPQKNVLINPKLDSET